MEYEEHILRTATQEPHMPARLYYHICSQRQLSKHLDRLRCVSWFDLNNFIISYYKEAKSLNLPIKYQDIPPQLYPINLAHGQLKSQSQLILDVRSFERAAEIAEFIDKHIDPAIIRLTHVATCNAHLRVSKTNISSFELDFDKLFADKNLKIGQYDKVIDILKENEIAEVEKIDNLKNKMIEQLDVIERKMPFIEKFAVQYPNKGKLNIQHDMLIRLLIALERPIKNYQVQQSITQRLLSRWRNKSEAKGVQSELAYIELE